MKHRDWQDTLVRFHAEFGPPSLFERVRFKMKSVDKLIMDGSHFNARASERNIPPEIIEKLQHFSTPLESLTTMVVIKLPIPMVTQYFFPSKIRSHVEL